MATQTMAPNHIMIDEKGVARVGGTRMKVRHLVEAMKATNATPEALAAEYPSLTLAQIFAALSYYLDHQAEMDAEIERLAREFEAARAAAPETPLRRRLRERDAD